MNASRPLVLAQAIHANAGRMPHKTALVFGDQDWTYQTLSRRIASVSQAGLAMDLSPGQTVMLTAANSPDYIALVLGLSAVGIAVATPSPQLAPPELARVIEDCKPVLTLGDGADAPSSIRHITIGEPLDGLLSRAVDRPPDVHTAETDVFAITYTSGTTGAPKGVMLSHRSRALTALAMANEYGCFGHSHRFLAATPLCNGAGFAYALANLLLGGSIELMRKFDLQLFAQRLRAPETTATFVVPTILQRLLAADARAGSNIAGIVCNAAALPQPLKAAAVAHFGAGLLHETYGSTEAGIVANLQPSEQLTTSNSCGRPFWNVEIELRDEAGAPVPEGATGELHARGPYAFNGYLGRPDATRAAVHDGWITVGDIARFDSSGFLHIVDRKGDMIITGGINVYPREVEIVLLDAPGVAEAAVVGTPSGQWGEAVHAVIVMQPGAAPDEAGLHALCKARLAPFKRPKMFSFMDELPRNGSGKLLRKNLRTIAAAQGAPR